MTRAQTRGNGQTPSAYRTVPPVAPPITRVVGMCRLCHRDMWRGADIRPGMIVVSGDGQTCTPCQRFRDEHPGVDPRDVRGTAAEIIPQERRETDPSWRADDGKRCVGSDPVLFEPDPDPDDDYRLASAADILDQRIATAETFCGSCPVQRACAATAVAHGYEGVWGGTMFTRTHWHNLLTGARGLTRFASARQRADHARQVERAGHQPAAAVA